MTASIGGMRTHGACAGGASVLLTQQKINVNLLTRIIDLEETQINMIGALQKAGLDCCDECSHWFKDRDLVQIGDRCQCTGCFCWEYFIGEDDDDATTNKHLPLLMRRVIGTPLIKQLPHRAGTLDEPFLSAYKQLTRLA